MITLSTLGTLNTEHFEHFESIEPFKNIKHFEYIEHLEHFEYMLLFEHCERLLAPMWRLPTFFFTVLWYCQAQPKPKLQPGWVALLSLSDQPSVRPSVHPAIRKSINSNLWPSSFKLILQGVYKKNAWILLYPRIGITCNPCNGFTNWFFLLKTEIYTQILNTEPFLYNFR